MRELPEKGINGVIPLVHLHQGWGLLAARVEVDGAIVLAEAWEGGAGEQPPGSRKAAILQRGYAQ